MEYRNHEIGRGIVSEGVVPVYFVEVPSSNKRNDKGFEQKSIKWIEEPKRRHRFELLPWFHHGEEASRI